MKLTFNINSKNFTISKNSNLINNLNNIASKNSKLNNKSKNITFTKKLNSNSINITNNISLNISFDNKSLSTKLNLTNKTLNITSINNTLKNTITNNSSPIKPKVTTHSGGSSSRGGGGDTSGSSSTINNSITNTTTINNTITNTTTINNTITNTTTINNNSLFSLDFGTGFGSSSSFSFFSTTPSNPIWVSSKDLILLNNFSKNSYYNNILNYNSTKFNNLNLNLKKTKYLLLFLTNNWQENWFSISEIQTLINNNITPVFAYWYFGDSLVNNFPNQTQVNKYYNNSKKLGIFLSNFNGTKLVLMEPEFNKPKVLATLQTQHNFSSIISNSIDIIKNYSTNKTYFSLTMTDTGIRDENNSNINCGYSNCSLGDKSAWNKTNIIYTDLINKLDFISFQEMISQFSRNPTNPGNLTNPNLTTFSDSQLGINYFHLRIKNFASFLKNKYNKSVFLSYLAVASGTFNDSNGNGIIDSSEFNKTGFKNEVNFIYKNLNSSKINLNASGLFGYISMNLFSDPLHDFGGYQYFNQNEYHLGLIQTNSTDGVGPYLSMNFTYDKNVLNYIFN